MIRKITNMILMLLTVRHYNRMMAWAKTQPEGERVDILKMEDEIGENWYASSCPYCRRYYYGKRTGCIQCPLGSSEYSQDCCDGLWKKMDNSQTWGEWIERAKAVKKYVWKHGIQEGGTG